MKILILATTMVLVGCDDGRALEIALRTTQVVPQCVWHLANDTSDSDETPGAATCDSTQLTLPRLDVVVQRSGEVRVGGCRTFGTAQGDSTSWCVAINGCGIADGVVCVNRLTAK